MRRYPVWNVIRDDPYDSLIDDLLAGRGLTRAALQVGPESLHPPEQMQDMATAAARLERAVRNREKIVVYGDYDVDGVCSTTVLMDFLEHVGADCDCLLPNRHKDGYGLKPPGVEAAIVRGARVIVTVDNGISAYDALELAAARGVEVVVVDHHQQLAELPRALAIVNPNRRDCAYPFKSLAGVGVTFKLVQALSEFFLSGEERRRYLNELLDLVALGTVADLVPVLGENRLFIQRGLQILQRTNRLGLRALKRVANSGDQPLDAASLGFRLGPRINVAGRLKTPDLALQLLRSKTRERPRSWPTNSTSSTPSGRLGSARAYARSRNRSARRRTWRTASSWCWGSGMWESSACWPASCAKNTPAPPSCVPKEATTASA